MPVEDVFKPKTVKTVDPRAAAEKEDGGDEYWARKSREAKNRLDYQEYEHAMRQLGQNPEPPFRISGEVSLGKIDVQEQARHANEAVEKARKDTETLLTEERKKRETVEQQLHQERIENLRHDFDTRIGQLTETIEKLADAPKKDERSLNEQFREQFKAMQDVAKDLGLERTSAGQDPMMQLELAKLSYQQSKEERDFRYRQAKEAREERQQIRNDEKRWQIEIQKLNQQAKKDGMVAEFPQHLGAAIARGIRDKADSGAITGAPASRQAPSAKTYEIHLPLGKQGTMSCPNCKAEIGIGPDTEQARCVNCKATFAVVRRASAPTAQEDEPTPEYYPEDE